MTVSHARLRIALLPIAAAAAFPPPSAAQAPTLRETVVTATRFPEAARSLPYGVSVITAEQIQRTGASTVNDALVRVLGLVGRQDFYGGGEYNIDLRGFGTTAHSNQVVVLDGLRLSEADLGGTRLAGIPIESVERIEVLRGSGAVLYGEGATGGVIVITTKAGSGQARPNGATLHAGAGSYGLRDLRANANIGGGGFSLDVAAQKRDSDNHRDNFRSEFDATSVTGQWSGDRVRLGARLAEDDLDTGLPGALTAAQYAANPRQTTTPGDRAGIRNRRASVFGELQLENWHLGVDAGQREKTLRSVSALGPFDYDVDASNVSLRARNQARIGSSENLLVLGMDSGRWTRDTLGAASARASQRTRAWYLKDDLTLAGGTRLAAGARTERLRKDNDSGAPVGIADRLNAWELGASHPVAQDTTVYARLGRSFRLPNVDEFSFTAPGVLLRPQTSRDLELGARWDRAGSKLEVRAFRSELRNEIGFDPSAVGPFGPFGANVNFGPTRRQGLELDATQALTSTVGLGLHAAVRRATFREGPNAGRDVPLVPRRTLAVRGDWTPQPGHRVTGGVNWVGEQRPDFANECRMPSYTTADVRYAYEWRNTELSLGVTNLFDRQYYTQAFACVAGTTSSIYPEAGRAVNAAVRVKF